MQCMQSVRYKIFPGETEEVVIMKRLHDLASSYERAIHQHALIYEQGVFYSSNAAYTEVGHEARTSRLSVTNWLMNGTLPHCFTWRGQEDEW